jgi:hypothetical protein
VSAALLIAACSGCAAMKAIEQPDKRDMKVLDRGVPRTHVLAELGAPVWSDRPGEASVDVFKFKQGYTKSTKAARAVVHGAADVATFGLWEVVGIPAESIADGTEVQMEVHYDADQKVDHVVVIKGDNAVQPRKLFARRTRAAHISSSDHAATGAASREPEAEIASKDEMVR